MSSKPRIDQLKGNVQAQESRLEQGIKMLNVTRKKALAKNVSSTLSQAGEISEWDALEKVIGLMDDLLTSYRKYTVELEKKTKKLETKVESTSRKR